MRNVLMAVFFWSCSILAADFSGKWSGALTSDEDGPRLLYLVLKQDGDRVTGSGGPDASGQRPLQNGKVQGDVLTFEISTGNGTMVFELKATDDVMSGGVQFKSTEGTRIARVSAKKLEAQ